MNVRSFVLDIKVPKVLFILSIFSLFSRLGNFCSFFQLTDSFLFPLHFLLSPFSVFLLVTVCEVLLLTFGYSL